MDSTLTHEFMTREQLAVKFQISVSTVARWQREGLPSVGRGRSVRFVLANALDWLASAPPRGSGQPGLPRPARRRGRPRNVDLAREKQATALNHRG